MGTLESFLSPSRLVLLDLIGQEQGEGNLLGLLLIQLYEFQRPL